MSDESLKEVKELIDRASALKTKIDTHKHEMSILQQAYGDLRRQILNILEAAELERLDGSEHTVYRTERRTWKVPQDPERRKVFFEWLDSKHLLWDMATVNHQTLNSWCRAEEEAALERGEVDFNVPGLDEPTVFTDVALRKK